MITHSSNNGHARGGMPPAHQRLLPPRETAMWLGISQATLYRLVERREIAVVRISNSLRFTEQDIEAYIASRRTAAGSSAAEASENAEAAMASLALDNGAHASLQTTEFR